MFVIFCIVKLVVPTISLTAWLVCFQWSLWRPWRKRINDKNFVQGSNSSVFIVTERTNSPVFIAGLVSIVAEWL